MVLGGGAIEIAIPLRCGAETGFLNAIGPAPRTVRVTVVVRVARNNSAPGIGRSPCAVFAFQFHSLPICFQVSVVQRTSLVGRIKLIPDYYAITVNLLTGGVSSNLKAGIATLGSTVVDVCFMTEALSAQLKRMFGAES